MQDLRYAFRQLVRSPGFTAVALLTLTLGMGANTAFFSVLYGVVLRQPPYPGAERLVSVHNVLANELANGGRLSRAEFRDYQERQRAFEGIAAADLGRMTLTAGAGDDALAERVKVSRVTANLFSVLGVPPARGRGIRTGDERAGAMAVVSHELWRSHFGGAEDILNRTIRLNGSEYAIVGVMPAGFAYPEPDMGAWMPLDLSPRDESDRTDHYLGVVGRRSAGVSAAAARLDLERVARELQENGAGAYPADARWSIGFESLRHSHFGRMLLPLGLLMAAAAAVLLIACVNVAIMSLLRALTRRREFSIRVAIGASRRDVIRQLVAEAVRPLRARRARRAPPRARRALDVESLRAGRHPAVAGGRHQLPHGALHGRGAGCRDAADRSGARAGGAPHERLRGHRSDGPFVRRPDDDPPARRAHGGGDRARGVAPRLRRADAAQPGRAGAGGPGLRDGAPLRLQDEPDRAGLSGRGPRRSLLRPADDEARVAAGNAVDRRHLVSPAERRRIIR